MQEKLHEGQNSLNTPKRKRCNFGTTTNISDEFHRYIIYLFSQYNQIGLP